MSDNKNVLDMLAVSADQIRNGITSTMTFIGEFGTLPRDANIGDVCMHGGEPWIFTGTEWQLVGSTPDIAEEHVSMELKEYSNCPNCGAPVSPNSLYQCEYCGTARRNVLTKKETQNKSRGINHIDKTTYVWDDIEYKDNIIFTYDGEEVENFNVCRYTY